MIKTPLRIKVDPSADVLISINSFSDFQGRLKARKNKKSVFNFTVHILISYYLFSELKILYFLTTL